MKIAIRLSCVAAAGFALAAGSAGADEGLVRDPPPTGESGGWPFEEGYYLDPSFLDGDPTGGACFYETMGGDGIEIASEMGFTVTEVYGGSCVADPGEANGSFDALVLCSILNGADPYAGCEPDEFLEAPEAPDASEDPEGSGFAGGVLGSSFGRTQFLRQSCVTAIRGRQAHEFATGAGVIVALLDTGIDRTHSLFTAPPERVLPGYDFVDADGVPDEAPGRGHGHGTTVAGLVLLAAPGATILPVRVLDANAIGTAGRIAAGIRFAADTGAGVVNLSLGGDGWSSTIYDAIVDAQQRGVVIVAAAGNARRNDEPQFPASVERVIAATGSVGQRGDVWAPSTGLAGPYPGERWFRGEGTSFSSALVSGGVALAQERWPGTTSDDFVLRLAPRRVARFPSYVIVDILALDGLDPVRLNLARLVR